MKRTIRRLNRKCLYTFGWTLKETTLIIGGGLCLAILGALWLNGMLPNNYSL